MTTVKYRRIVASVLMLCYVLMASHWGSVLSLKTVNKLAYMQGSVLEFLAIFENQDWDSGVLICNNPDSYVEDRQHDAEMIAKMRAEAKAFKGEKNEGASCSSTSTCCCAHNSFSEQGCTCAHDAKASSKAVLVMNNPCESAEFFELSLKKTDRPELMDAVAMGTYEFKSFSVPQFVQLEGEYEGKFVAELGKVPIAA